MSSQFSRYAALLVTVVGLGHGQVDNTRIEVANLRQDVALLTQRVGELTMPSSSSPGTTTASRPRRARAT